MVGHKGILQCLHEIIDRGSGYVACEDFQPVFCRSIAERVIDRFGQLIAMRQSILEVFELLQRCVCGGEWLQSVPAPKTLWETVVPP